MYVQWALWAKTLTLNLAKWSLTSDSGHLKKKNGKSLEFVVPKRCVGFKRERSSYVVFQKVAKYKIN